LSVPDTTALRTAVRLRRLASARLPTPHGLFQMAVFAAGDDKEHVALWMGELESGMPLVRIHSECLTGDAFMSLRCDCGPQLQSALAQIAAEGRGAVLYLRQEGRGIGLANKIRAYALQDEGADTVEANHQLGLPADARDFGIAVAMLEALKVRRLRLMTNNPRKLDELRRAGFEVVERVPIQIVANPFNAAYLATKARKMGHLLDPDA
jgi:GTP cyclohydrolase II